MEQLLAQKMEYFGQMLSCIENLYFWEFDPAVHLVKTTCPNAELIRSFLALGGCEAYLLNYIAENDGKPLVLADSLGLSWIAGFEVAAGQICRVYMIGPVFTSEVSSRQLEQAQKRNAYPPLLMQQFLEQVRGLPIIPIVSWLQYGQMLHFSVRNERIMIGEFNYQAEPANVLPTTEEPPLQYAKGNTWLAEQTAMKMIEDGRLDYQKAFGKLSMSNPYVAGDGEGTLQRKHKNAIISFVTLCTRAAIRGGLDPETAYFIGEHYLQYTENTTSFSELMRLNATMYDDFIQRVHKAQTAAGVSAVVRTCCDFVELHLYENPSIKAFAADAGYSEYYLTQKFKKEMGMRFSQYVKKQKIEQAKLLLQSTNQSVQDISETLGFCNPSYFIEVFRTLNGVSPGEYRNR